MGSKQTSCPGQQGRHPMVSHDCFSFYLGMAAYTDIFIRWVSLILIIYKKELKMNLRQKSSERSSDEIQRQEDTYSHSENEQSYIPRYRRSRRKINTQMVSTVSAPSKKYNESFWSDDENVTYMRFLEEFAHLFQSNWSERKSLKINVLMSNYIKTRSPLQCRSHHQKMMKFHESIPKIITHLRKLIQPVFLDSTEAIQKSKWTQTEIILQDLSQKVRWAQEQNDIWERIMNQGWLSGAQDY